MVLRADACQLAVCGKLQSDKTGHPTFLDASRHVGG